MKPYSSFANLLADLKSDKFTKFSTVWKSNDLNNLQVDETFGVAGNTFRAFRREKEKNGSFKKEKKPSQVYRENCIALIGHEKLVAPSMFRTESISDIRKTKYDLAKCMKQKFNAECIHYPTNENIFPYVKLIDLTFKSLIHHPDFQCGITQAGLFEKLEVPLDKYSLLPLREKFRENNKKIKANVSMGWVNSKEKYEAIQDIIRREMNDIRRNPIDYDIVSWNFRHLTTLENKLLESLEMPS